MVPTKVTCTKTRIMELSMRGKVIQEVRHVTPARALLVHEKKLNYREAKVEARDLSESSYSSSGKRQW